MFVASRLYIQLTCIELKIVKSHANTAVFSLTANSPNTHVSPSRGSRIKDAFSRLLLLLLLLLLLNVTIVEGARNSIILCNITIYYHYNIIIIEALIIIILLVEIFSLGHFSLPLLFLLLAAHSTFVDTPQN